MMDILTAIGTIIAVIIIQVARDWRDGKSLFKRNGTAESVNVLRKLLTSQETLANHFNHDTTKLLEEIRNCIKNNKEISKGTFDLLEEIKEYGVKIRKE